LIDLLTLLPPEMFPPEIQPLIYFTLMPLAIGFLLLFMLGAWFIWFPPEARLYIMNKLHKKTMFDVENEAGVRFLDTGTILPEGIAVLDKSKLTLLIGRPVSNDRVAMELAKMKPNVTLSELESVIKKIRDVEKVTLKPSIVKGLGCRIFRVYQSFGVATSLANLVGLEYSGQSKTTPLAIPILAKTGKRLSPAKLFIKKGIELAEWIVPVALPVDATVSKLWSHLDVSPLQADKLVYLGERRRELQQGSSLRKWLPYILLIIIIIVIALGAILLLGGGGVQQVAPQGGGV
jgi:hypothetical protein